MRTSVNSSAVLAGLAFALVLGCSRPASAQG